MKASAPLPLGSAERPFTPWLERQSGAPREDSTSLYYLPPTTSRTAPPLPNSPRAIEQMNAELWKDGLSEF
jgi:hypothetical protein